MPVIARSEADWCGARPCIVGGLGCVAVEAAEPVEAAGAPLPL